MVVNRKDPVFLPGINHEFSSFIGHFTDWCSLPHFHIVGLNIPNMISLFLSVSLSR
jgi:hypothetical protein